MAAQALSTSDSCIAVRPRLTLEQAVEGRSLKTVDAVAAHRQGPAAVRDVFQWMA
jgi:hypothetical protein